jgi:hydroxymethylbilane synthase
LALAQAHEVQARLSVAHAIEKSAIEIVIIKTTGDQILDRPLSEAGGKGLFTKELDTALIRGDIDFAVHSAKDLPTALPEEILISGYLPREDVRDVLIAREAQSIAGLRPGAVVGTASLRRGAMLKKLRPDVQITLLRGNVQTRLGKVEYGEVDATLLALAGLKRLGLEAHARVILDTTEFLPAAGQGAIGITARRGDDATGKALAKILDAPTGVALSAERAFLTLLDGSCKTPIGAHAEVTADQVHFRAIVLRPDGSEFFEEALAGSHTDAATLGETAARKILGKLPPGFFQ